jgi:hypothetical protein
MSLINNGDFLMHGVVLQNRVFRTRRALFHVKHSCVKDSRPTRTAADVSRETVFSGAGVRCFT